METPAFFYAVTESLANAAIAKGLEPELANKLAIATIIGSGKLLEFSGKTPAELRDQVTSPGGMTAAGLKVFAEENLTGLMELVLEAARKRSIELS